MLINYRKANHWLLVAIIVVNAYVIVAPFWPQIAYWVQSRTDQKAELQQQITKKDTATPTTNEPDSLTIPSMLFNGGINQGTDTYKELEKGVWLWPGGSRPDKGSNTIMLAHRFTYTNPRGAFYFLDKVKPGDKIGVTWQNKHYVYVATGSKTVAPTEVSILNPTVEPTLTLYTCTPLWNPHSRLVVTAKLEQTP